MSIPKLLVAACLLPFGVSSAAPVITGVTDAAAFQKNIASAQWVAITGSNLAQTTQAWGASDFSGGNLPTKLADVQSVAINGKPAYIYFVSPGQINVLAPDDAATGRVPVQVTNSQGTSNSFLVNKQTTAPALFALPQENGRFGVIQATLSYGLIGPPGLIGKTVTTSTAVPGEQLILYGSGLGPVTPAQPTGQLVQSAAPTANPVTVTIGGKPATVQFAGLIGAGLYQINVIVPVVTSGDSPIVVSVAGNSSTGIISVPVQSPNPTGQTSAPTVGCLSGALDYIKYSTALLSYGDATEVSIGGTKMCASCNVQVPIYPEFVERLEHVLLTRNPVKKKVQACYDQFGNVFQLQVGP